MVLSMGPRAVETWRSLNWSLGVIHIYMYIPIFSESSKTAQVFYQRVSYYYYYYHYYYYYYYYYGPIVTLAYF